MNSRCLGSAGRCREQIGALHFGSGIDSVIVRLLKKLFSVAILILVAVRGMGESFELSGHRKLIVDIPQGWISVGGETSTGRGMDIRFGPSNSIPATQIACRLTSIISESGIPMSDDRCVAAVREAGQQFVKSSVEKKVKLQTLNLKSGFGCYTVFTDKDLVGKAPKAGVYKVIAAGMINPSSRLLTSVTIFAEDASSQEFRQAVKLVESCRLVVAER